MNKLKMTMKLQPNISVNILTVQDLFMKQWWKNREIINIICDYVSTISYLHDYYNFISSFFNIPFKQFLRQHLLIFHSSYVTFF